MFFLEKLIHTSIQMDLKWFFERDVIRCIGARKVSTESPLICGADTELFQNNFPSSMTWTSAEKRKRPKRGKMKKRCQWCRAYPIKQCTLWMVYEPAELPASCLAVNFLKTRSDVIQTKCNLCPEGGNQFVEFIKLAIKTRVYVFMIVRAEDFKNWKRRFHFVDFRVIGFTFIMTYSKKSVQWRSFMGFFIYNLAFHCCKGYQTPLSQVFKRTSQP